ncbi:aromatase/cyclase [Streptomyces sp. NPDC058773]|uniref:aromatase/cyclase n=1 Tax=Streptomyces sp. NPDC058773 TaxID=3346632 RepID=UPI0036A87B5C
MPRPTLHRTEHALVIDAPADALYALVADVTLWPAVFEPTVAVHHLERTERTECFEIWAVVADRVAHWTSRRTLDPRRRLVSFRQEHSNPPFRSMSGAWLFRVLPGGATEVVLRHRFALVNPTTEDLARAEKALEANSTRELAALARAAGSGHPVGEVVFSFTDSVAVPGPVEQAYEFVERADRWHTWLPHVSRVALEEPSLGIQYLEMDTTTADGAAHTTRSVRVCRAPHWIAYKQQLTPPLLAGHSGEWTFSTGPQGTVATSHHTVALRPEAVPRVLGAHATLADARAHVRDALSHNSRSTLEHARTVSV